MDNIRLLKKNDAQLWNGIRRLTEEKNEGRN
jgi:hypothetical protein